MSETLSWLIPTVATAFVVIGIISWILHKFSEWKNATTPEEKARIRNSAIIEILVIAVLAIVIITLLSVYIPNLFG